MQWNYRRQYEGVDIFFRGQSNFKWQVETTLERFSKTKWTIRKYFQVVHNCISKMGNFKDHTPNAPNIFDVKRELDNYKSKSLVEIPKAISFYLTYFRHYGFPLPL